MKRSQSSTLVTICNRKGLHARASAAFVRMSEKFVSEITVSADGHEVGGRSIMALMTMAAGPGSELTISARGPDAEQAIAALGELVRTGFGEDTEGHAVAK